MYVLHPVTATAEGLASKSRDEAQAILRRAAAPSFRSAAEAMGPVEHPLHVREVVELGDPAGKIVAYARAAKTGEGFASWLAGLEAAPRAAE